MRLTEENKSDMIEIFKMYILIGLIYMMLFIEENNQGSILRTVDHAFLEYIKISMLPLIGTLFTVSQFSIAYNNREISRKKCVIDLEDKTIKEFSEIKEILEAITLTQTDCYKELLTNMKIKDKSVEEKLLDKMEGKRFKFNIKYDNEAVEYKKQIKKMHSIIVRNIDHTQFFLDKEETFFNLSEEDINCLKNNSKKINDYFMNNYKKNSLTSTEEIYLIQDIKYMLDELGNSTGYKKIDSIKKSLDKVVPNNNTEITWVDVQNAAKSMIEVIEKI